MKRRPALLMRCRQGTMAFQNNVSVDVALVRALGVV